MATAPEKVATATPQYQSSATLAQLLQARLDAGASAEELIKLAADAGVALDPVLTQQMVDYGKGARFEPGIGGEITPATPEVAPSPASQTPLGAAIAGTADVFAAEPSLGLDPTNRSELEKLGILGRYLYAPLGDIGAAAYTTAQAGLMGAAQGTGQLLENIGVLPAVEALTSVKQTPQSFAEQTMGIADFAAMKYPFATIPEFPARTAPTLPRVAEVAAEVTPPPAPRVRAPEVAKVEKALPPVAQRAPQEPDLPRVDPVVLTDPETPKLVDAVNLTPYVPGSGRPALEAAADTTPILAEAPSKKILDFQKDYAAKIEELYGARRPEKMGFSEFVYRHVTNHTLPKEELGLLMEKHNMGGADDLVVAMGASRESLRLSAQELNRAQQVSKTLRKLYAENPQLGEAIDRAKDALENSPATENLSTYHRIMGIQSGALTPQLYTAATNVWSGNPIIPTWEMIVNVADAAIRTGRNLTRSEAEKLAGPSPWDAISDWAYELSNLAQSPAMTLTGFKGTRRRQLNDRIMDEFAAAFPRQNAEMFRTYASELMTPSGKPGTGGKVLEGAEKVVDQINVFNRVADRFVKNTYFPIALRDEARRAGVDFDKLFDEGKLAELDKGIVEAAIDRTQRRLFQQKPATRAEKVIEEALRYTLQPIGMAMFPRYLMAATRFMAENNPAAIVRFASGAERAKVAAGDARAVGKIAASVAAIAAFMAVEDDPYQDGKWNEYRLPNGDYIDTTRFLGPLAANKFIAHYLKAKERGETYLITRQDVMKAINAPNFSTGASAYIVEQLWDDLSNAGTGKGDPMKVFEKWAGEKASGLLTFFRQFKDVTATLGVESDAVKYQPQTFGQQVLQNFPGGAALYENITGTPIPTAPSLVSSAPQERSARTEGGTSTALLRQLTGTGFRENVNYLDEKVNALKLAPKDLYTKEGIEQLDYLMARRIGQLADQIVVPALEQNKANFEKMSVPEQRMFIRKLYGAVRKKARDELYEQNPLFRFMVKFNDMGPDRRKVLNDLMEQKRGKSITAMFEEAKDLPIAETDDTVNNFPAGTRYMDLRDFKVKVKK